MASTWLQVPPDTTINRAGNSLPCGMDMGYLRRPRNPRPPLYSQMGVSTPSFAPTSLRTTRYSSQTVLRLFHSGRRKTNLPGAVSTLVLIARPTQCVPGQLQDSCRTRVTVNVLTPTLSWVRHSRHLHIRCLRSTAPALAVPCSPMPMVTSVTQMTAYQVCSHLVSVCVVDHVLHGNCPDVMTLGSQQRAVAYYARGE